MESISLLQSKRTLSRPDVYWGRLRISTSSFILWNENLAELVWLGNWWGTKCKRDWGKESNANPLHVDYFVPCTRISDPWWVEQPVWTPPGELRAQWGALDGSCGTMPAKCSPTPPLLLAPESPPILPHFCNVSEASRGAAAANGLTISPRLKFPISSLSCNAQCALAVQ